MSILHCRVCAFWDIARIPNRLSRTGRALADPGLQFSELRIPARFFLRASSMRTTILHGPYSLCTRCLSLKSGGVMGKNKALIPTNSVKRIHCVENADQRCGSPSFECANGHGELGLVATWNDTHPLMVTSARDLQSPWTGPRDSILGPWHPRANKLFTRSGQRCGTPKDVSPDRRLGILDIAILSPWEPLICHS